MSAARIWVVDDDRSVRFVLSTALREAGYAVEGFDSAQAAQAALRTTPAISPAASPEPANRSPRAGPVMAEPVSCAIIRRRNGVLPKAVSVGASM